MTPTCAHPPHTPLSVKEAAQGKGDGTAIRAKGRAKVEPGQEEGTKEDQQAEQEGSQRGSHGKEGVALGQSQHMAHQKVAEGAQRGAKPAKKGGAERQEQGGPGEERPG